MKGTTLERWVDLILKGSSALGKDWTRVSKYKRYLEEAGFEDVVEKRYEWPVGTWAKGQRMKMLGMWYREDLLSGLQGLTLAVLNRGLGMSIEEIELLLIGVRDDIKSNKIHIYIPVFATPLFFCGVLADYWQPSCVWSKAATTILTGRQTYGLGVVESSSALLCEHSQFP
jgi:hypothetical protein